jgi:hypothetical protein
MVIIVIVDFNRQFFSSLQFFVFQFVIGIRSLIRPMAARAAAAVMRYLI